MGAPMPDFEPVENASAEALLDSLKTIDPAERRRHASVFNYWQSIRGQRDFPPIRDLDPLEISDAGPFSLLLEMVGGGEDALIRHFGHAIRGGVEIEKIGDAPNPSLLSCIHAKLPIVAACREALAFEESFDTGNGPRRCWVTLLPFSATGTWIDFVYGYVSIEGDVATVEEAPEAAAESIMAEVEPVEPVEEAIEAPLEDVADHSAEDVVEQAPEPFAVELKPYDREPEAFEAEADAEAVAFSEDEHAQDERPSFTAKFMESLASVGGFYGKVVQADPEYRPEDLAEALPEVAIEQPAEFSPESDFTPEPESIVEGSLQNKLTDVRALAQEAHEAQVRSNVALYEGLSAAYDFALDAEEEPEQYLRLVEAQGLKIQLRAPMQPVVKLAFDGMCDEPTIKQLEAVLAWAFKEELPRGTLAARIQEQGGIGEILKAKAA